MTKELIYRKRLLKLRDDNQHIAGSVCLQYFFDEVLYRKPKVIVELGTGVRGLRTQVVCWAAALVGAKQISVDLNNCWECGNSWSDNWYFVQREARECAEEWPEICKSVGARENIDYLVIDTDEKYETTWEIWKRWSPFLSRTCSVLFRCSNLQIRLYYKDGRVTDRGWNNNRGVVRVIEEILELGIDERSEWHKKLGVWDVLHYPWGAGLTILRREE